MSAKKSTVSVEAVPAPGVVQPAPIQQPAYDPSVYYQKPVDPNKGKAKWLTFEYALAMITTVLAAGLLVNVITTVFGLWFGSITSVAATGVGGWVASILSISTITPGTGIVAAGVLTVLLAVVAFVSFGRVSQAIPEREGYTDRLAYKAITYGGFASIVLPVLVLVAKIGGILISSVLFIGVSGAGEVYKSLYLAEFLPYLLSLGVLGYTALCLKDIIGGKNNSKILTAVLIAVASVVLFAGVITVAVKSHSDSSSSFDTTTRSTLRSLERFNFDY